MTRVRELSIAGRPIGPAHRPYVIAELSGNHNGDFERAMRLMEAAAAAGADAVKLQTYTADTITIDHDGPGFRLQGGLWHGRTLHELYQEAQTPWEWQPAMFAKGRELGVAVFSSPFDATAIEFLASLNSPAFKIASFECIDLPLIAMAAKYNRPLIISTGMADVDEIGEAVAAATGAGGVVLMHCVSGYPTPPSQCNLRTIPDLGHRFPHTVIGLSDHTLGTAVATAAIALGASVIEKHLTLARADGGPDAEFSLEPPELSCLVENVRTAWEALGEVGYSLKDSEQGNVSIRRSLYAVRDIAAGEILTADNVRSIRPGGGLAPKHYPAVLGRRSSRAISFGTPLSWDLIE